MKISKSFLCILVAAILLVSVFFAGTVFSAGETENEISILVHKRTGNSGPNYFRSNRDYELIEDYDSFMLIETSEENAALLQQRGYVVENLENRDHVGLQSYSFRTGEGEPDIPEELKIESYPEDGSCHYIVQFIGPIRPEWSEQLKERGVVIHEFRQRFNFIVEMDVETKREVEDLDFVNWVGIYQPAYRFDGDLLEGSGELYLEVSFFEGTDPVEVGNKIMELDCAIDSIVGDRVNLYADAQSVEELAKIHGVRSITEGVEEHRLLNDDATWITQTNEDGWRKVTDIGVTGKGQLITVMDSELDVEHEAFSDPDDNPVGFTHRKVHDRYVPEGAGGDVDAGIYHGTHVTGTVLGNSPSYDMYSNHDGHAMDARVIFQDVSSDDRGSVIVPPDMYSDGYGDAYDKGSRIHTNSWGGGSGYTDLALTSDEFIWDHKDFNIVFAAGNSGPGEETMSAQGEAKNILTVGGVQNAAEPDPRGVNQIAQEHTQDDDTQDNMYDLSSRGYAEDGRIKPTILHVAEWVTSAGQGGNDYESMSGTSMSAPGIAGQAGQVSQYYIDGWYPSGEPNMADGFNPSSALVKSTLINGAVEISGTSSYENDERFPNNDQGFGRSKLDRALHFQGDSRNLIAFDSVGRDLELATGDSWSMEFEVDDPSQELEVTLVWSDYPGPDEADEDNPALMNDLDLELTDPDGTRYVGNAFTGHEPGYSDPDPTDNPWSGLRDGEFDGLNVEENILLLPDQNDLEEGTHEVTVTAHNVPRYTQPFALVISGGVSEIDPGKPDIEIQNPTGGEEFDANDDIEIQWDVSAGAAPIDVVDIELKVDEGFMWEPIATIETDGGEGSYTWTLPNEDSEQCYIRVTARDEEYVTSSDASDAFTIEGIPPEPPRDLKVEHYGTDYADNLVTWRRSVDDDDLSQYHVYRSQFEDGDWDQYDPVRTVIADGSEEYSFVDHGRGIGDDTTWWYVVRSVGMGRPGIGIEEKNEDAVPEPFGYELSIEVEGEGTTDPRSDRSHHYTEGDEVDVAATPEEGWHFVEWSGDVPDGEEENEEITIEMDEDKEITAHFEINTYELIVDIEGEGDVELNPSEPDNIYDHGTEVILTATPEEGWRFLGWTGDHTSPVEQISLTMDEEKSIEAHFEKMTYELAVDVVGEGSVDIDSEQDEYDHGTEVTLTAIPDEGHSFVEWSGDHQGDEEEITIIMDEYKEVTAHFEIRRYELSFNIQGEGDVSVFPDRDEYDHGRDVELRAIPDEHWYFVEWTGDYEGTMEEITITMYDNKEVTAHFEEKTYGLNTYVSGDGHIERYPDEDEYSPEDEVTMEAVPDEDWEFVEWSGDIPLGERYEQEITIVMDQEKEVTAHFRAIDYFELTVNIEGEGIVEVDEQEIDDEEIWSEEFRDGTELKLEAISDYGWEFHRWTGDYMTTSEDIDVTMNEDRTVTANFERQEFELVIEIGEGEGTTEPRPGTYSHAYEEEIIIEAIPNYGWVFDGWSGDYLEGTEDDETITISIDESKSFTANFIMASHFEVEITSPGEDEEFYEGDEITVEYSVRNTGDIEGVQDIEFYVDDMHIDTETVSLGPGESYEGEFRWETEEDGEVKFEIFISDGEDLVGSTVDMRVSVLEDPFPWWIIIVIVLIVVGVVIAVLLMGKKEDEDEDEEEETEIASKPPVLFEKANKDEGSDRAGLDDEDSLGMAAAAEETDLDETDEERETTEEDEEDSLGMAAAAEETDLDETEEEIETTEEDEDIDEDQEEETDDEESNTCQTCGSGLRYIDEYEKWYCDDCQEYR